MTNSYLWSYLWGWAITVSLFSGIFLNREAIDIKITQTFYSQDYICPEASYTPRIVSYSPLIVHLENFLSKKEREYLISLASPSFKPSMVLNEDFTQVQVPGRTSSSAFLPSDDRVISCVRDRALSFQGFAPAAMLEPLQAVKYLPGQEYGAHYDWGVSSKELGTTDRITTFFAVLKGQCEHCGTHFPLLRVNWTGENEQWCRIIDCETSSLERGTIFQALEGTAVFWRNLDDELMGDTRVLHEGMKLESGEKIGLNIWTRSG